MLGCPLGECPHRCFIRNVQLVIQDIIRPCITMHHSPGMQLERDGSWKKWRSTSSKPIKLSTCSAPCKAPCSFLTQRLCIQSILLTSMDKVVILPPWLMGMLIGRKQKECRLPFLLVTTVLKPFSAKIRAMSYPIPLLAGATANSKYNGPSNNV